VHERVIQALEDELRESLNEEFNEDGVVKGVCVQNPSTSSISLTSSSSVVEVGGGGPDQEPEVPNRGEVNEFGRLEIDSKEEPEEPTGGDEKTGEELEKKSDDPVEELKEEMEDGVVRGERREDEREATRVDSGVPDMVSVRGGGEKRLLERRSRGSGVGRGGRDRANRMRRWGRESRDSSPLLCFLLSPGLTALLVQHRRRVTQPDHATTGRHRKGSERDEPVREDEEGVGKEERREEEKDRGVVSRGEEVEEVSENIKEWDDEDEEEWDVVRWRGEGGDEEDEDSDGE
jgi:hypothetical protein